MKTMRTRERVKIERISNTDELGEITKAELLKLSEEYDPENYNQHENMDEKEFITPSLLNKEVVVTIRFSKEENDLIIKNAQKLSLSKSAYIRSVVLQGIDNKDNVLVESIANMTEVMNNISKAINDIAAQGLVKPTIPRLPMARVIKTTLPTNNNIKTEDTIKSPMDENINTYLKGTIIKNHTENESKNNKASKR